MLNTEDPHLSLQSVTAMGKLQRAEVCLVRILDLGGSLNSSWPPFYPPAIGLFKINSPGSVVLYWKVTQKLLVPAPPHPPFQCLLGFSTKYTSLPHVV